jgi:hypothetical protein
MKRTIKCIGIAIIAAIALSTAACSGGGGKSINSAEALKAYLDSQPGNSLSNPIKVNMAVNDLTLIDIVDVIKSADNYVSLNLSGNALTTIGKDAFKDCNKLLRITIPSSVKNIDTFAFSGCTSLAAIYVDSSNANYSSSTNGILYNKDKTVLLLFPQNHPLTEVVIYTDVAPYAFYGSRITKLTLGGGGLRLSASGSPSFHTQSIYENAFINCTSLTSVRFEAQGLSLEKGSFDGDLFEVWDKATTIEFSGGMKGRNAGFSGTFTRPNGTSMTWARGGR